MTDEIQKPTPEGSRSGSAKRVIKWVMIILVGIIVVILFLGLIPVSVAQLDANPSPVADYDQAIQAFDAIQQEESPIVNDASGSLLMTRGDKTEKVYVLIHGTTNSPRQWEELGNTLHEQGHNVLILRMPHHGLESHSVSELKALRAEELRDYADRAIDLADGLGDEITVIGISGGGAVTAWIAQHRPDVDRIVALSPFFGVPEIPGFLNTFLMNLASRVPNVTLQNPSEPQRDWVYRGEATRGVAEFMRLGRNVLEAAESAPPAVSQIYFVTTAVDDTADNDYTVELAEMWRDAGVDVSFFEFDASLDIPHNSVDPAADPGKKALVYAKILEMLDEGVSE
ncbi:MAG: alpha/beta hydrolase [Candidatus Promineifilaceae bacterium]